MGVLSHPQRLRIVMELGSGELDVSSLQKILGTSHSAVSQHLANLRAHRLVEERREGRHVYYRLSNPSLVKWLISGIRLAELELDHSAELRQALEKARASWAGEPVDRVKKSR